MFLAAGSSGPRQSQADDHGNPFNSADQGLLIAMKSSMLPLVLRFALPIVMALALALPAWAQVIEHKLTASDGAVGDNFGFSVSLSASQALVGAYGDDDMGFGSGSAMVFERQQDGSWLELDKLTASDGAFDDHFGYSVSIWGKTRALVGASGGTFAANNGSAYVFEWQGDGSWLEVAKLTASDGAVFDLFGLSVSISGGNRVLVGAYLDDDQGIDSGSAYVYEWQGDGSWLEVSKITASDGAPEDFFGASVSLSGEYAIVGAGHDDDSGLDSGSAYVYERQQGDGSWLEVAKLTPSDGAPDDDFGGSVSISGDYAIVGAVFDDDLGESSGSAYVFERQGDGYWLEVTKLTASDGAAHDLFGHSVSLSGDRTLVGAYFDDDLGDISGSAYVFERQDDGTWLEVAKLTASDGAGGDIFGFSVSISGNKALVGAYLDGDVGSDRGAAYVFENIVPVGNEIPVPLSNSYRLSDPYPNPFNPQARFSLEVAQGQQVRIEVFNTLGQRVDVLHEGLLPGRGTHHLTFEGSSLPSGVYLLRVTGETFAATRTMTLVK